MFLRKWGGYYFDVQMRNRPISAVIIIKESELESTLSRIEAAQFPRRIIFNIVLNDEADYPINYLRNLGSFATFHTHI